MVERTRLAIFESFNDLLARKDLDKITIEMIAKGAGVSKATFYRYFKDKYDVMAYNYKIFVDHSAKISHSYEELLRILFRDSEKNMEYLENAFKYMGVNSFIEYVYEYSFDLVNRITLDNRPEGLTESEVLQLDVFCHGVSRMFGKWIMGGYDLSAEDAAKALYREMPETLREYWWKERVTD